ncbi:unnamed protein product [Oppiella nova]|uniref:Transcription initiation factor IIF subunit alpha n=1 Tax=Oppiella nova TaxID=334625 RepID=A0A7R9LMQ2_9ACAR|nr:unnamed protein product [Oppiella nova]CAG2165135.1 unnamed protein product [Oppiella nova]
MSSSATQEFIVRVPREMGNKKFNVMRFGSALNVEPNKWKSCQMSRENDVKDVKTDNEPEVSEFGAGSEFGRKQREEMKRKKYMKRGSGGQQPWILKTGGKLGKKYKGLREGGVSENASYYVFFQAPDGAFEAFPVKEWYNFTPIQRYKALTAEEAEEKFEKRDKILNYFSVMINKKRKDDEMADNSSESKAKMKKELKVSDMDDWHDLDSDNERSDLNDNSDEDVKPKSKKDKKGSKAKKPMKKKKKKGSDDSDDSEPLEESDEGDFDDKEVDYMSDSSDSSEESETEKNDKQLKGVEDEDALRQLS